jgi:hypothetical protein
MPQTHYSIGAMVRQNNLSSVLSTRQLKLADLIQVVALNSCDYLK